MKLWEILTGTTEDQAASVEADLTVGATVEGSHEEDLLLVGVEASTGVETEEIDQCIRPLAATAEKSVKCLLDPQTVNLSTAAIVLKKWEMAAEVMPQDKKEVILDPKPRFQFQITHNLMP